MLPINNQYEPMEAKLVEELPSDAGWQFEPKWDGFRCLVFREGERVELISKSNKPLDRYFPELHSAVLAVAAQKFVLDSEIVIPVGDDFSFDDLLQRIHPAESRVIKLAKSTPAAMLVFDMLVDEGGAPLFNQPLSERRAQLERFAAQYLTGNKNLFLSPATSDPEVAEEWQRVMVNQLDGIMAKRIELPYQSGNRLGMLKVKKMRTADCVVGGFRYASAGRVVGSLLLGLYDQEGKLNHVGFTSSFTAKERQELLEKVRPLMQDSSFTGSSPGQPSRWNNERTLEWQPLKPELVAEVRYDHFTQGRFRHGTKLLRWRPDKLPEQCGYDQLGKNA